MLANHTQPANPTSSAAETDKEAAACGKAPLVEAATGQAVAEATLALMWAVLGSSETGESGCRAAWQAEVSTPAHAYCQQINAQ